MPIPPIVKAIVGLAVANGLVHYAVDALLDPVTLRALVIAVTTGIITGVFGIVIARIQRDSQRETHERLEALEQRATQVVEAVDASNVRVEDNTATALAAKPDKATT